jgi:nucleoside-diphosphate-sugar epimerase
LDETTRDGDTSWTYARVKLALEREVLGAARDRGFPGTVVQPANTYGPFCKPWTNAPAEMLLYGGVILPDRGEGICNALYVDDLVDALLLAAEQPAAIGERFLVSGPEAVTWRTFFDRFARTLGTAPPIYWPAEKIARTNRSIMRDIRMVIGDPKKVVQLIVRWPPARRALQSGLDAMSPALRALVSKYYFDRGGPQIGDPALPAPQTLALYASRATVDNAKAARLLGYAPKYGFEDGMSRTMQYVDWAYGDIRHGLGILPPAKEIEPGSPLVPGQFVNAS